MFRPVAALALLGAVAFTLPSHAQQPATTPDPKMPPMPSMEAPDVNDTTKPAGPIKPSPSKVKQLAKPPRPVPQKAAMPKANPRNAAGKHQLSKGPPLARKPIAARPKAPKSPPARAKRQPPRGKRR